jgi:hypothetical protein
VPIPVFWMNAVSSLGILQPFVKLHRNISIGRDPLG